MYLFDKLKFSSNKQDKNVDFILLCNKINTNIATFELDSANNKIAYR